MDLILNIETATPVCSVALSADGELVALAEAVKPQSHSTELTVLIEKVMSEAEKKLSDLSAVAVSSGPGSYTGLRIGTSVAKGIGYALDIPMIAVGTLEALAHGCRHEEEEEIIICPMIDARRMEVYTALYKNGQEILEPHARIIDENSFADHFDKGDKVVFCGDGAPKCKALITHPLAIFRELACSAQFLIELSHKYYKYLVFCDLAYFSPSYIKAPNITQSKKKL
ncbi:MAG: tRNA (adenosine(37)-N6)-threonylcarbamoyltransferase complex dimerization subunit type 1 TsaB [Bacteroidota bacterium]